MTITYDFIAFSGRLSQNTWTIGMRTIQGEVPLDVVLPSLQSSTDVDDKDIIGVLTKEGFSRESSDVMELYRYLRQLNPKTNQAFGYNEVVIRNIHTRLNSLQIDRELRVQITYTERKENYIPASYNIKLLGTYELSQISSQEPTLDPEPQPEPDQQPEPIEKIETDTHDEIRTDTPIKEEEDIIPKDFPPMDPDIPVYKSTNTLEKLITLTRSLESELKSTTEKLAIMTEKVQSLEEERKHYRELESLLQDIVDRLNYMESFERRIENVENVRYQIKSIQDTLTKFFRTSNRQTQALLKEVNGDLDDLDIDS